MKKAYNESWIENIEIQQIAKSWADKNLITISQSEEIKNLFSESFYRPGIFVKIGLFLFTILAGCFFSGFISLLFLEGSGDKSFAVLSVLCAAIFFFALEYFIKERKLFHSGIDNALLYMASVATIIPAFLIFENLKVWEYCFIILFINTLLTLRYADLLIALISVIVTYVMFSSLAISFPLGKELLPFGIMILSAVIYFLNRRPLEIYYKECQVVFKVVALIGFYLGGNYYVVREGNALLADLLSPIAPQIPFAPLFYFFTAIIPLLYCFWGLKSHDRVLLIIGLLITAFSCFTYRYYFDFLSIELVLTLAGAILILLTVFCMRYFQTPKMGLTDEIHEKRNLANLEAILVAHHLGQAPGENNMEFGGGDFGGGGAGNDY